ncbi:MAG: NAD-dependent epimerase/dehydratase family protein [Nanoarchaeota archaeon]|nr:MAG: NAD-dependent epimerase/dehydratase family protein [Nanoarchaeota archaeon]
MKILVTGGAGFVGSHVAEYYAKGNEVIAFDNLSRGVLLKQDMKEKQQNVSFLKSIGVRHILGDIRDFKELSKAAKGCDVIFHLAAQTAVTTSVTDPRPDFETNALGTFNVMEAARTNDVKKVVYASTNKVYGENVNEIPIEEKKSRYAFKGKTGIPETFSIDHCEHTPYGVSKLTGDLYAQDYGKLYGIKTGVFRMSCIYGTRQFGLEDQGWVAWFAIAALLNKKITIFGDGKQVRDVLYVTDLVKLYDAFLQSSKGSGVYNAGGGPNNTMSLMEYLEMLQEELETTISPSFAEWRPSDQKVYISDISKAKKELGWEPKVSPKDGVKKLVEWAKANKNLF